MELSRDNLHHAYLIEGGDAAVHSVRSFLADAFGISLEGNPDLIERRFNSLGIDDARWLKEEVLLRPLSGTHRFYIIHTRSITVPAQNALLKTLEEPTEGTHLFFVIPRSDTILPTLLSRVALLSHREEVEEHIEAFLSANRKERLEMIAKFLSEDSRVDPADLASGLARYVHRLWMKDKESEWESALREIVMVERYMYDSSASHRFLLEHLALVLPTL